MSAFVFLLPAYWPALLLVPALVALAWWVDARGERRRRALLGQRLEPAAGSPAWPSVRRAADGGAVLAVAVALLQPVGAGGDGAGGADVVLCVDASWSMAARDEVPTRLRAVQREIEALATGLGPSRLGLVVFAGDARLVAPLTADATAVAALAGALGPGAHGRGGSDPGAAIDAAATLLARAGHAGAIVVLGDGEDFAGGGVAAAARAAAAGATVHAIGCGSEAGSKIVVDDGGRETFLRGGDGADVVTRLDRGALEALVAAGNGTVRAIAPGALAALHGEVLLPAARAAALRAGRVDRVPLLHLPLLAAFVLWMLRWCLPERRR